MTQQASDNLIHKSDALLQFFEQRIASAVPRTAAQYSRTVSLLSGFANDPAELHAPTEAWLRNWVLHMWWQGITHKSALHMLDIASALYGAATREGLTPDSQELFISVRKAVRTLPANAWRTPDTPQLAHKLRDAIHTAIQTGGPLALYADMALLSLTHGALSVGEMCTLSAEDDAASLDPEVWEAVHTRCASTRRSYLFGLQQGKLSPRQVQRTAAAGVHTVMLKYGLPVEADADTTLARYWAAAALNGGIPASAVLSALPRAAQAWPALAIALPDDTDNAQAAHSHAAAAYGSNPQRWYAMKLRPRVSYDDITERMDHLPVHVAMPALYYPTLRVARREGRRTVFDNEPLIKDVVFFRTAFTNIAPLMAHVGHLAWCYTNNRAAGAYASIPTEQMAAFQQAAGLFTDLLEVGDAGSLTLQPGEKVQVIDGLFAGHSATLQKVITHPEEGTVYRLLLVDNRGIEWRVKAHPSQVTPTNTDN